MRSSSILLPLAGTIALAAAAPIEAGPPESSPVLEDRSPAPDIGAFLDDLPALIGDIVSTSISIVTALKQAVKDDALVRNDLDNVLGPTQPPPPPPPPPPANPGNTTAPGGADEGNNELLGRQDLGQGGEQNAVPPVNGTAACPDVAVLFARGLKEPGTSPGILVKYHTERKGSDPDTGNVGFLAGPPLFAALETYVNGTSAIAVQGISYRSKGSSAEKGPALMADLARRTAAACPDTRIAMAGYSAGAVVVRSALEQMAAAGGAGAVNSVVLFGDPRAGQPVPAVDAGRVTTFCHEGDVICRRSLERQNATAPGDAGAPTQNPGEGVGDVPQDDMTGTDGRGTMLGAHLDYGIDAPAAAMFVMQRSGLGMASVDAVNQGMDGTLAGMVQDIARNNGVDGIAT